MKRVHQGFFFIVLFVGTIAHPFACSLELIDFERQLAKIDLFLPVAAKVSAISWHDSLENADLKKLLPAVPAILCPTELKKLVFYCAATRRYERITFSLDGDQLSITLDPAIIFERCAVKGYPFGSEAIEAEFLIKPGMAFNEQFHKQAVVDLENCYKKKGFLDATVQDQLQENEAKKTVQAQLELQKGNQYPLDHTALNASYRQSIIFEGNKSFAGAQLEQLTALYGAAIEHIPQEVVAQCVREWYQKQGYIDAKVEVKKRIINA